MTPDEIKAAFAAEGWTVTTIAEACEEMERLSGGWRSAAIDAIAWKSRHDSHCAATECEYRHEPAGTP